MMLLIFCFGTICVSVLKPALLREDVNLSSYVSRHSWATSARNNNVSLTIISEGLGHSSERMTRICLGSFNAELIDRAKRALMHRMRQPPRRYVKRGLSHILRKEENQIEKSRKNVADYFLDAKFALA